MKKIISLVLLIILGINIYASDNYTIAIVPLIQLSNDELNIDDNSILALTNSISEKSISDINLNACNEILSIFNNYLINIFSLNDDQKYSYLLNQYNQNLLNDKELLSSYYVEKINNNYSTYDSTSLDKKINELKIKIDKESKTIFLNNSISNTENEAFPEIEYPTNLNKGEGDENSINVKIFDDYVSCFLLSNFGDIYTPIFERENNVNEIIFVEVDKINDLKNLKIYSKDLSTNDRFLIYDRIIVNDSLLSLTPSILLSLTNYYFKNLSIVKNNIDKINISIKEIKSEKIINELKVLEKRNESIEDSDIIIDFDTSAIRDKDCITLSNTSTYLLLESGVHYLLISGNSITDYVLKVISDKSTIKTISKVSDEISRKSYSLYSNVGNVDWVIDGKSFGVNNSLVLDTPTIPSVVLLKKDNFSSLLFTLNSEAEYKAFELNPSWMDSANIFEKKQSDFYQGLLNYILGCATFISIKTINNIYGNSTISPFIDNISDGMLILAQLDIVYELVSYIKLATK